jgi:hypothetical protein
VEVVLAGRGHKVVARFFFHFVYGSKMFNIQLCFPNMHNSPSVGVSIVSSASWCRKLHQAVAIDLSVRHQKLVRECGISFLADRVRLSPLHGFAFSQVTISFLCLLISR